MFSFYSVDTYGTQRGWDNDMEALTLKQKAQLLQAMGDFEAAVPVMLASVAMRERSHTLCLSLSELGELYLDMLKFAEAEAAARRMLVEARRYDTKQQIRIADEILANIAAERGLGLGHGAAVRLRGLVRRSDLNNKDGIIRGRLRDSSRCYVDVGMARLLVLRRNLVATAPVLDDEPAEADQTQRPAS